MLGSPCSPCCAQQLCGIDWSLATSVSIEIEAIDYYSRWHGKQRPGFSAPHDYWASIGFLGSRLNGTFELTKVGGEWVYEITDAPQFCPFPSFAPKLNGISVQLFPTSNVWNRVANIFINGSNQTYVVRGSEGYTDMADMRCVNESAESIGFSSGAAKNGRYLESLATVDCTASAVASGGQFVFSNIPFTSDNNPVLNYGGLKLFYMLDACGWVGSGSGSNIMWYGGFYPNGVGPQENSPPFYNVRLVSSTIQEPYEWETTHEVRMSSVVAIKKLLITL